MASRMCSHLFCVWPFAEIGLTMTWTLSIEGKITNHRAGDHFAAPAKPPAVGPNPIKFWRSCQQKNLVMFDRMDEIH